MDVHIYDTKIRYIVKQKKLSGALTVQKIDGSRFLCVSAHDCDSAGQLLMINEYCTRGGAYVEE